MEEQPEAETTWKEVFSRDDPNSSLFLHFLLVAYTCLFVLPAMFLLAVAVPFAISFVLAYAGLSSGLKLPNVVAIPASIGCAIGALWLLYTGLEKGRITWEK